MASAVTFDELVAATRGGADNNALRRLLGPTEAEQEAARKRLAQLDKLDRACQWEDLAPSNQALEARERWQRVASEQRDHENTYC